MSPRKQTVDQQDDVDDEDGAVQEEARRQTDLKLHRRRADEVALGGTSVPDQEQQADDREER
jgi:hypothetical protein